MVSSVIRILLSLLLFLPSGLSAQTLPAFIDAEISKGALDRATWGILIEEQDGTVAYERNSGKLLMPASNRKLFSSAFAYDCLGPQRRLTTEVWTYGAVRNGVLEGDLVIVGDGDPTFGGRFYPDRDAMLEPLAARLERIGINTIRGNIIADVSLFGDDTVPPSWSVGDLWTYYGAPVDALAFNENVIGTYVTSDACNPMVTTDPSFAEARVDLACGAAENAFDYDRDARNVITIGGRLKEGRVRESELISAADPARYTAAAFLDFLERRGIRVDGEVKVSRTPARRLDRIYTFEAPPLLETLGVILDNSQNLFTEMLLKRAAAESQAAPITYGKALRAEEEFLSRVIGISRDDVEFVDGSGLSPEDVVTPRAALKVVRWMMHPTRRGHFLMSLARPGSSGTLRRRLAGLEGVVYAKTGYIHGVAALSGIVLRKDGRERYFSIIVNHYATPASEARGAIDAIVRKVAE